MSELKEIQDYEKRVRALESALFDTMITAQQMITEQEAAKELLAKAWRTFEDTKESIEDGGTILKAEHDEILRRDIRDVYYYAFSAGRAYGLKGHQGASWLIEERKAFQKSYDFWLRREKEKEWLDTANLSTK